jgi:transposase
MLLQAPNLSVWLYVQPADMRKQFNGLITLVQTTLNCAASKGDLFVFVNRRRTLIKILYYSREDYCLWSKKLEQECFQKVAGTGEKIPLNWAQLQCLIDGINWQKPLKTSDSCS